MRDAPTNNDDIIDSRDVLARIEELTGERDGLQGSIDEAEEAAAEAEKAFNESEEGSDESQELENAADNARGELDDARTALKDWEEENGAEIKALQDFEAQGSSEWRHGETLIRESYFENYARELADEIGAIPKDASWPATCIDWEQAARELQMDYTGADFDGITYYYRG